MANWTTDDPMLQSPVAPHETNAVMRMHRGGWPGEKIMRSLRMRGRDVVISIHVAMDEEQAAYEAGRPIHDAPIEKGTNEQEPA